jgi:hypothetical protein
LPGLFDFPLKTKIFLPSCFSNSWSGDMALKRSRKIKEASRIPGVPVGDEVNTSIGKGKKASLNFLARPVPLNAAGRPSPPPHILEYIDIIKFM